jgi:hypothetical protein
MITESFECNTDKPWGVVSFFTEFGNYRPDAMRMIESCKRFGLDYYVWQIPGEKNWLANCRYKPQFLKEMLKACPGKNLVWIDADGVIQQYPILFDHLCSWQNLQQYHIGVHYFRNRELLTGTVYLKNCPETMQLLDGWIDQVRQQPNTKEQLVLQMVLPLWPQYKVFMLPPNYCQIYDLMKWAGKPVIEHFQASRRLRAKAVLKAPGHKIRVIYGPQTRLQT